jgi:thiol-disulfide isomerase/thioredoxin
MVCSICARTAGAALVLGWLAIAGPAQPAPAADNEPVFSAEQKPIADDIGHLRSVPDDARGAATRDLAMRIRRLPASANKLRLAIELASLSTEGDFGRATLDQVATTLAAALREAPLPWTEPPAAEMKFEPALMPAFAYRTLAQLARYEGVAVPLEDDAHFRAALAKLEADDRKRDHPDFTLNDLSAKPWHMGDLHGKVVLVNFWATWCPPCRKEVPSLEALDTRFASQGLVIIGISDEDAAKVEPFVRRQAMSYPILLDPGRVVNRAFAIQGIPKSFVYDRSGKLVATAIDMRTERQFLDMLAKAGLR